MKEILRQNKTRLLRNGFIAAVACTFIANVAASAAVLDDATLRHTSIRTTTSTSRVEWETTKAQYESGATTVVGFTGMPYHIDATKVEEIVNKARTKAEETGISFDRNAEISKVIASDLSVRTKLQQPDQPLPSAPHLMALGGDANTLGCDPKRNLITNARNLRPLDPRRAASHDFEGVNWDEEVGDRVPQAIADLMANHPAIYTSYVLPRIGMSPISYGADTSKWNEEREQFFKDVDQKAKAYFDSQAINPCYEAEEYEFHPFATQNDPTGGEGAAQYLKNKGLTYRHLLTTNPFTDEAVTTEVDSRVNIPFTSNPYAPQIVVSGNSFYFRPGRNAAIDMELVVTDEEGVRWFSRMERKSNQLGPDGKPARYPLLEDGSPFELAYIGGMVQKYEMAPTTAIEEQFTEGGILLNMPKILAEKFPGEAVLPAYGKGIVAKEGRQTSTSETESLLYRIEFKGWKDLVTSTVIGDIVDVDESTRFVFVREDLLAARVAAAVGLAEPVLASGEKMPRSKFFASHGDMAKATFSAEGRDLANITIAPTWQEGHLSPVQIKTMVEAGN